MKSLALAGLLLLVAALAGSAGARVGVASKAAPKIKRVVMPRPRKLPAGARTFTAPGGAWRGDLTDLAAGEDAMWVSSNRGVYRIDRTSGTITGPFGGEAQDVAVGGGAVWTADYDDGLVKRLDGTGRVTKIVQLPDGASPEGIVATADGVWVGDESSGLVERLNPANGTVVTKIRVSRAAATIRVVGLGLGSVWVDNADANVVARIDIATDRVLARIHVPSSAAACGGIAVGARAVWVTSCLERTRISRIDPRTNKVAAVLRVGGKVIQPVGDGRSVWFVVGGDDGSPASRHGYLVHLRGNDTATARFDLGRGFRSGGAAIAFGALWLSDFVHPDVVRLELR